MWGFLLYFFHRPLDVFEGDAATPHSLHVLWGDTPKVHGARTGFALGSSHLFMSAPLGDKEVTTKLPDRFQEPHSLILKFLIDFESYFVRFLAKRPSPPHSSYFLRHTSYISRQLFVHQTYGHTFPIPQKTSEPKVHEVCRDSRVV